MANTFTNLIALGYAALDVVSRELVGFIPSVTLFPGAQRVAKGQTIYSPVAPANTQSDITPAMTVTAASDQTIASKTLVVDNFKTAGFNWTGEEQMSLNTGPGSKPIMQAQIEQAMRVHVNAIETAVGVAIKNGASRATGTAGTTPFASDLSNPANVRKILDDNGAPASERSLVIDTTAGAKLRTLAQLTKANEASDTTLLRQGTLLDIHGFAIRESAQVATTTAGAMTGALFNGAGAVGDTTITFDTGTVNTTGIVAGDVITVSNYKYVVATGTTSTSGTFTINAPGLREVVADNTAISVNATSTRNAAFAREAVQLATRLPASPEGGDQALLREVITDPRSGLSFEMTVWPGYRMFKVEIAIAYGVAVIKPEHIAILLG
jgi:hypothetical protein